MNEDPSPVYTSPKGKGKAVFIATPPKKEGGPSTVSIPSKNEAGHAVSTPSKVEAGHAVSAPPKTFPVTRTPRRKGPPLLILNPPKKDGESSGQ